MKSETFDAVHDMTLEARSLLISEIEKQLEGIYGLLPTGEFKPADRYPILSSHPEAAETRKRLELLFAEEQQVGIKAEQARQKLVRETAFTWLNRLVAFKMMEARKLIKQTVTKGQESNNFKLWLVEAGNEEHYKNHEAGDLPVDGVGEGPRQKAYRNFLLAICGQLSKEIRVLFDPDNLPSRLCPRPPALKQLLAFLNDEKIEEAWQPGNEEVIGWIYQFFIETRKKEVFDRLYNQKKKIKAQDIPAATQIFTPRWIVRCLVENTLGRMWIQMHPDTRLTDFLNYLVPPAQPLPEVALKPVSDIKILDPSCGTMHFGLVAIDLLVEMYQEELEHAGQDGWPEAPSVQDKSEIPAAILAKNLHGIDIDLRAVQLSALTLFLRAKAINPKASLTESRLACADIRMLDGERLKEFLKHSGLEKRPIYGRILSELHVRLKDSNQLGSLLRLEKEVQNLVDEERKRYERENKQPDLFGWSKEQFETEAGRHEFWEMLETQIGQALNAFARERASDGSNPAFFTSEATKGLRFLEISGQRYDVVFTNPPYMTQRNMNSVLKEYLKTEYPAAKSDLYAAFIQRCAEWLVEGGRLGMITQQSFMFISSYEKLRTHLRKNIAIEVMPHVGPRAFAEVTGEKVNTILLIFRQESDNNRRKKAIGTYFRLVKEIDAKAKRQRFELALSNMKSGKVDNVIFLYEQGNFDAISGSPWVYWISGNLRNLFISLPPLGDISEVRQGLTTADTFRFIRYWWEVGRRRIDFSCINVEDSAHSKKKWFPLIKGGNSRRWHPNEDYVVNWGNDGVEVKAHICHSYEYLDGKWAWVAKNSEYYFMRGITWNKVSSGRFAGRLQRSGFIFSDAGCSIFPPSNIIFELLGILNSRVVEAILSFLSPTINYEVGQISKIPIPEKNNPILKELVEDAISLSKSFDRWDECSLIFSSPQNIQTGLEAVKKSINELRKVESKIDDESYLLYDISDEDRAIIEVELAGFSTSEPDAENTQELSFTGEGCDLTASEMPLSHGELSRKWISFGVGIILNRFEPGTEGALGRGDFSKKITEQLHNLADSDGIMVLDEGHSDDLARRAYMALQAMLGDYYAIDAVREGTGRSGNPESDLRYYLERKFFKEHITQYKKRPVYWLFQSPRKKYGIWLFHERLTKDTLYRIRGAEYVGSKINLLEANAGELRGKLESAEGRERRNLEKKIAEQEDILEDVRAFAKLIDEILQQGYTPHIDDGVLINMAPLWQLIPSWQAEPKKCWQALERGDYDWAHQAMDHWPERVRQKCQENISFAIAHGLVE